jgi:hypothetical protein
MRAKGLVSTAGSSALLLCLLVSASAAQEPSGQRAPVVRIYSQGGGVVSSYVTPAVEVSENAYVFAVMMDLDGHIQVLHPDYPGISIRIQAHKQLGLPSFFAGYNPPMETGARYNQNGNVSYDRYQALGNDTRGSAIALASRAPFNLGLIEANGDWSFSEIRRLIEHRSPAAAAQSLARYLGAKGEPIGQDFMRFAGQRQNSYYAYDDLGYCGYGGYGYGALGGAFYPAQTFRRAAELRSLGLRPVVVGYDACGLPVIGVSPFTRSGRYPLLPGQRRRGDTTVFPKSRMPAGFPRHPAGGEVTQRPVVPEGIFPLPQRAEPRVRDVAIPAPQGRRAEPRDYPDPFRSPQPVSPSVPDRARAPVEPTTRSRAEPAAATGAFPVQRAEPPRVIIERAPPPAPAPTPRVNDAPPRQPPPPPKAEPAAVPPPRR